MFARLASLSFLAWLFAALPAVSAPVSMTRPANTTTYTANTGWCSTTSACTTYFTFPAMCPRAAARVAIYDVEIWSSANPTTKLQGNLWLFDAPPATVIADNAAFAIASADFAHIVGRSEGIQFALGNSQASAAGNSSMALAGATAGFFGPIAAQCGQATTSFYGMVQVVNTYSPASAETLTINVFTQATN
jgi:hypothetical protein